ncbi:PP2C family protein-serine/threonine phosphatase [Leucobacter sp. USHLN153]|uniref:PP2C family protein-serine/threonine phosphatase n=1 Tax=Leucobacter sp. USHLN153 TaxID=3081268 RepID=UPI00301A88E5
MRMDTLPEVRAAARTDVGMLRSVNEDSACAEYPVFLVADGMGGHEAGEEASRAAIEAFVSAITAGEPSTLAEVGAALEAARDAVARVAADRRRGAGCTLTGAVLVEHDGRPHWLVLNIGDSRVYLHRGADLHQITVDHSLRDEMIAGGAHDPATLPGRNVITRALGSADTTADSWLLPVEDGARLLICSDGLTTEIDDHQLRAVLTMGGSSEAVAEELVRRANTAGGRDNITVIVVDVVAGGDAWHIMPTGSATATEDDVTLSATVPRRGR